MRKLVVNRKTINAQIKKIEYSNVSVMNVTDNALNVSLSVGLNSSKYRSGSNVIISDGNANANCKIYSVFNNKININVPLYSKLYFFKKEYSENDIVILVDKKMNINNITLMTDSKIKFSRNGNIFDCSISEYNENYMVKCFGAAEEEMEDSSFYIYNNFITENGFDLNSSIFFGRNEMFIELQVPLESDKSYNLVEDNNNLKKLSENIKNSLIPDIVNNERRQFIPCYQRGVDMCPIKEIEFNFHFRDRTNEGGALTDDWVTNDTKGWNCYTINGLRSKEHIKRTDNAENGDEISDNLKYLGFTEDDIRFQKKKIKKSFLRLMFYSDRNPLSQELLCYSTIFFDSNKAYAKYNKINALGKDVFDDDEFEEYRLSSRITINDKYDLSKSSEGFYLYLFPDEINGENNKKTIYMKAEFNHAGYGKTIPLMIPTKDDGTVIKSESEEFPCNFIKETEEGIETDIEKYYSSIMIPLTISYDDKSRQYVYSFSQSMVNFDENKLVFNFFEPRIRWRE